MSSAKRHSDPPCLPFLPQEIVDHIIPFVSDDPIYLWTVVRVLSRTHKRAVESHFLLHILPGATITFARLRPHFCLPQRNPIWPWTLSLAYDGPAADDTVVKFHTQFQRHHDPSGRGDALSKTEVRFRAAEVDLCAFSLIIHAAQYRSFYTTKWLRLSWQPDPDADKALIDWRSMLTVLFEAVQLQNTIAKLIEPARGQRLNCRDGREAVRAILMPVIGNVKGWASTTDWTRYSSRNRAAAYAEAAQALLALKSCCKYSRPDWDCCGVKVVLCALDPDLTWPALRWKDQALELRRRFELDTADYRVALDAIVSRGPRYWSMWPSWLTKSSPRPLCRCKECYERHVNRSRLSDTDPQRLFMKNAFAAMERGHVLARSCLRRRNPFKLLRRGDDGKSRAALRAMTSSSPRYWSFLPFSLLPSPFANEQADCECSVCEVMREDRLVDDHEDRQWKREDWKRWAWQCWSWNLAKLRNYVGTRHES